MAEIRIELRDFDNNTLGDLDITSSDEFPLSLTYQNFDIRDFNSRNGGFSKTFKVPATKRNNKLLNHIYQDGNIDKKNVRGSLPSTIYSDNIPIVSGTLKITKILKGKDPLEYECNFLSDNMDWASKIKNKDLKELTFDNTSGGGNTGYVFENMQGLSGNARDAATFNADSDKPLFPLLSVGEGVSSRNQVTDADFVPCLYVKNIWDKIFEGEGYVVDSEFCNSEYFKSLIVPLNFEKQSELINDKYGKIEKNDGYTKAAHYFHDSNPAISTVPHIGYNAIEVSRRWGYLTDNTNVAARYPFSGNFALDDSPLPSSTSTGNVQTGGNTHPTLNSHTMLVINETGTHTIDFNIDFRHYRDSGASSGSMTYKLRGEIWEVDNDLDQDINSFYQAVEDSNNGNNTNPNIIRKWDSGTITHVKNGDHDSVENFNDEVEIDSTEVGRKFIFTVSVRMVDYAAFDGGHVKFGYKNGTMEIKGNDTINVGEDYSPVQFLLPKGKQSDFVSGISQMFNLQFFTDSKSKIVKVEPYDYFYQDYTKARDWTSKIDYSKPIEDEFINDIKSELIIKYKDASGDAFLERFNKKNDTDWGSYRELNDDGVFADGTYKVENKYFSPSFNWYEGDYIDQDVGHSFTRRPFIPVYHTKFTNIDSKRSVERAEKEFNIGARVLITLPVYSGANQYLSSQSGIRTGYSYNNNGEAVASNAFQTDFCRANFFHLDSAKNSADNNDTFDSFVQLDAGTYNGSTLSLDPNLSFNNITYDFSGQGSQTHIGLYQSFYSKMVGQLKQKPRIKTIYLNLSNTDMAILDFTRLVFIDGNYYRINKIIDFKPHLKQSTKVELVEYLDLGKKEVSSTLVMNISDSLNL